jgi:hypothetical protein
MTLPDIPPALSAEEVSSARQGAISFDAFREITQHPEALDAVYESAVFTDAELARLKALPTGSRLLAIVEVWCPDVTANLPIAVRAAEASGLDFSILPRPQHRKLAERFPGDESDFDVPTYVAIDAEGRTRGVLVNRPERVSEAVWSIGDWIMDEIDRQFPDATRDQLMQGLSAPLVTQGLTRRREIQAEEQAGFVDWLAGVFAEPPSPAAPRQRRPVSHHKPR